MKSEPNSDPREAKLFLKSLEEKGVAQIYLTPSYRHPEKVRRTDEGSRDPSAASQPQDDGEGLRMTEKEELLELRSKVLVCTLCSELASTRKSVVFGAGNIKAKLMFVGEAPGRDEDLQGLPFVGAAGQLLTKIIESIGLSRQEVFIANVLKCRPPQNRPPRPDEILNCQPYLQRQIELIKPNIICALGTFAAQTLLKTGTPISQLRGKFHDLGGGVRVLCTYHPAYLLRNPADKRKVWEDMKMIKKELEKNE